jgi:hypothetical protein
MTSIGRELKVVMLAALLPALGGCYNSASVSDARQTATAKAVDKYRSVITATDPDAPEANVFFDAVEAGNSDALLAFPVLRPHLDAGSAESADISLSMALAKNPMGVLALLNSPEKVNKTCVSNFIEPDPGVEQVWYRNAERALSKIGAKSALAARRDACLEIMRSDEQNSGASAPVKGRLRVS